MIHSLTKLVSNDTVQDTSSSKGVAKTIKKRTKGKNILDLIGGVGSFATILEKSGTILSTEKKGEEKSGSVHNKGRLTSVKNEVEKELLGNTSIKAGKNNVIKKEEKIAGNEAVTLAKDLPLDKTMKQSAEVASSKVVLDEKTEKKFFLGKLENSQFLGSERSVDKEHTTDLTKALHGQRSDSAHNESASEPGETVSLIKDIPAAIGLKKAVSRESMPAENEPQPDLNPTTDDSAKEIITGKRGIPDDMRQNHDGNRGEDRRYRGDMGLSKGFEIKGVMAHKASSNIKEPEMVSNRSSFKPESGRESIITTNTVNQENEIMQVYKTLLSDGRQSEKSVERSLNDILISKADTSQWTAQADFSGLKGIVNFGSGGNTDGGSVTPLLFQDIMDQIEESTTKMLKKGPGRIVITLEPPNLGTLNVDVKVHNDMVRLLLIADNHEVKQVLHSNLDQLKTALQNQGLNMDHFDVLVQQKSSENPGFHQWGGALFEDGRGRRENTKEDSVLQQPVPGHGNEVNEPHLGIISLFA